MKTVFVVDDNNVNLITADEALSKYYRVFTLPSAENMFELLEDITPNLILLDIMMPGMNGFEAMSVLKSNSKYKDIPVIFLTGRNDETTESHGIEMGAVDFISKPFSVPVLLNRLKSHLDIEELIRSRTYSLERLKNGIVYILAKMVENRDQMTGNHVERTTTYVKLLLDAMSERGLYAEELKKWNIDLAVSSARLHDIGKIVISDSILNKPGRLTPEEFEIIKTHAIEGVKIIDDIVKEAGDETFLQYAKLFTGFHHERWDGNGYPYGLKGEAIPLQGRIMAVADVYDALVSDRPYKQAFTHEKATEIMKESRGTQFDPKIIDVFLEINEKFADVCKCH